MRNFLKNLLLLLLSLLLFLAAAEVICRLFYDESVNYQPETWRRLKEGTLLSLADQNEEIYIDERTNLVYDSDSKLLDEQRYEVFRTAGLVKEKEPNNSYRILILGDSFTVGRGLKKEKNLNYVQQLSTALNDKNKINIEGVSKFEIIVLAAVGLNTFQELELLKQAGLAYQPDLVILQYCDNDVWPTYSPLNVEGNNFPDTPMINSKSRVFLMDNKIVPAVPYLEENSNRFLLKHSNFIRFLSYKINIVRVSPSRADQALSLSSLREMATVIKTKGARFMVIDFPPAVLEENYCGEVNSYGGMRLQGELKKITSELGVPFYNMCDYVAGDIRALKSDIELAPFHYGEQGHLLATNVLISAIINMLQK